MYKDDCTYDEGQDRRRPISKAYVAALEDRVAWLERTLENREAGDGGSGQMRNGAESENRRQCRSGISQSANRFLPSDWNLPEEPVECLQV